MSREIPFSSFREINHQKAGRVVAFFGAGEIAAKTARKLDGSVALILDNNPNHWGTQELGAEVTDPKIIAADKGKKYFVVITTTSFAEVAAQLSGFGLKPGKDFIVSPILNDLRIIAELEQCKGRLLFTSGAPVQDSPQYGGGVYELKLDGSHEYRKVLSGNSHGVIAWEGGFIAVDDHEGLIELDSNYKVKRKSPLPQATRAHGIAFSERTNCFYVVASYMDQVLVFDRDFNFKNAIKISHKYDQESGTACHHCNDICVVGSSAYVSMFSHTGNWKKDIFDGVVLEIDIESGRVLTPVIKDLWMPHNVAFYEGSLVVLDSLRGELKKNNAQVTGRFPGFARGLAYDGRYYFIGQSRNRNYSKYLGLSYNISIDTSIIVFDDQTKVSRTLHLPSKISEVHSILSIT